MYPKVQVPSVTTDCWLWAGSINPTRGYGRIFSKSDDGRWRESMAHRVMYENLIGPIPKALVLDHVCRVRSCVNPAHLEPVTQRLNILRGVGPTAVHARRTHCARGHELTPDNVRVQGSRSGRNYQRLCKACRRDGLRAWRLRRRTGRPVAN
jgi:hypothetical protein